MYRFTREFLEYLADKLQIGDNSPNYDMRIYKKINNNEYDSTPVRLGKDIFTIDIDRRWNMAADELQVGINNINGQYSPDYSTKKLFDGVNKLYPSGYNQVLVPFNQVEIDLGYNDQLVRIFTGQLQEVDIKEVPPTINIAAKNEFRKLLKPIDPVWSRSLIYENKRAIEIIIDLCKRAGVDNIVFDIDEVENFDYTIEKAEFELGTFYKDAIDTILETMGHRIYADRFGVMKIQKLEVYTQKDVEHWEFNDYVDLSQGGYKIDSSIIRNRIIVQSESNWKAYEDPYLINYCNGERIPMGIEVPWAETDEQKKMVANNFFIQMRRKLRRITIGTIGNPTMDTGDLAKLKMLISTANDKYMIVGIRSSFSDSGYFDIVDLEFVSKDGEIAVEAKGDYGTTEEGTRDKSNLAYSTRDKIVDEAKKWIGTYYQWGGNKAFNPNHYGLDCSHFTYTVYSKFGLMDYYRTAIGQYNWAKKINKGNLQKGDLVFYTNSKGTVNHVGIYIGNDKVISANGGDSTTTTIGKARQRNAKVKIHNLNYRKGNIYYGKAHNI